MSTHRDTWKAAERRVAAMFGTLRQRLSGSSGRDDETAADTKHPVLFIEVKYREKHAVRTLFDKTRKLARREGKTPLVALVDKGRPGFLLCLHIDDLPVVANELRGLEPAGDLSEDHV
jgi:hypothetical protein